MPFLRKINVNQTLKPLATYSQIQLFYNGVLNWKGWGILESSKDLGSAFIYKHWERREIKCKSETKGAWEEGINIPTLCGSWLLLGGLHCSGLEYPDPRKPQSFSNGGFRRCEGEDGFRSWWSSRGSAEEPAHKRGLLLPDSGVQVSHVAGKFFCHEFEKSKSFELLIFRNTFPRRKAHCINNMILRRIFLIIRRITVFWDTQL